MNKEEIRHFKSLLRQGSLRHMNIVLDDKFQKELLNVIKDYEGLQQRINDAMDYINFLIIFNENINGKFNETIWGEELLNILGGDVDDE